MLVAAIFAVLSIALFAARFVFVASGYRFGSMGATSLTVAYLLVISAFFVSGEPGRDRNAGIIEKQANPVQWYVCYLSAFMAGPIFLYIIWSSFA